MTNYAFMQPVEEGKTEEWRRLIKEMKTTRKNDLQASRKHAGLTREEVWLQQTPMGDFAVVYWEGANIEKAFEYLLTSKEPVDKWFREKILVGVHGMDPKSPPPPMNEKLFG